MKNYLITFAALMGIRTTIKKISAVFLLAVFVLCNTPTNALHSLFSNHTDSKTEPTGQSKIPQLYNAGIDCHCVSNVVNAPYLPEYTPQIFFKNCRFIGYSDSQYAFLPINCHRHFSLRGPPVLS